VVRQGPIACQRRADDVTGTGRILVALDAALGTVCLRWVARDYRRRGKISGAAAWAVWVAYLLHSALTVYAAWMSMWRLPVNPAAVAALGGTALLAGAALLCSALAAFRSLRRMSGLQEDRLIDYGIYRYSRNPQSVGWAMVLLGISIIGRSGARLLLTALSCLIFRLYLPFDEHHLHEVSRLEYERYCGRTGRYFGLPGKPAKTGHEEGGGHNDSNK
jgi:protein-S-isoprenylcysteine O-methyltransferase Ste14